MGGSFFSGAAPNVTLLIAFRGLQALGAAMLAANSPAILTKSFPAEQRGQALGLQATMTYLGLTAGPSLGGWLASLVRVAGSVLHQFTGWIGCHLAELAFYP